MALQAQVEKHQYFQRCKANVLVNTVIKTWNNGHLDRVITHIFLRFKNVLCNITDAKGGNNLVESKWGKKISKLKIY